MRNLRFALLASLALAFVLPAFAGDRKSYPMNLPAAGVESVVFDVQEGDFVVRGPVASNPTAAAPATIISTPG